LYLFYRAYKKLGQKSEEKPAESLKWNIFMGIVSGIVPCTFGWSIFLLLFSLGKLELILPMILSLWIGIFLFLLLVLTLTYFLRRKFFDGIEIFSQYSSLISSGALIFVWIYLLTLLY
jgi:ABC-type nickel/cobalt efflux system permease component RcnA